MFFIPDIFDNLNLLQFPSSLYIPGIVLYPKPLQDPFDFFEIESLDIIDS